MSDNGKVAISVSGITLHYGSFKALDGVEFEGGRGQLIGLIGPNGCGKSTLLRCINGALRPRKGAIMIDGEDVSVKRLAELARICSNVPTEFPTDFNLTVMEMVMMGRYPYVTGLWWEGKEDEEKVKDALSKFGVEHLKDRKTSELSSGERQRTLIAKAYVQEPKVMLVDEPTSHLDMRYKLEVMEYLRGLAEKDMTIIVASHDINLMAKYCDMMIIVKEGRIVSIGRPEEVITAQLIRDVYKVNAIVGLDEDGDVYAIPKSSIKALG